MSKTQSPSMVYRAIASDETQSVLFVAPCDLQGGDCVEFDFYSGVILSVKRATQTTKIIYKPKRPKWKVKK